MAAGTSDRITQMTQAGIAAATGLARELGLPADEPRLLSSRGNVLVHLAPAPVVARVATLSAWTRADPFRWLEREVAVAGHLAGRGAPVVAPTALADPGPHWSAGLAVSLWTLVPASDERPTPAQTGRHLARLHAAAKGFPGDLPDLVPIRDLATSLDILEREQVAQAHVLDRLRALLAEVLAGIDAAGGEELAILHGDAHAGNLLRAATGWAWIDLEETCRGPREFDLLVLASSVAPQWQAGHDPEADGQAALAAYASELGTSVPEPTALAPFGRARDVQAVVWLLGMAHQYPERYQEGLSSRLARVLRPAS